MLTYDNLLLVLLQILYGAKTVFTRSAITPPKVNRFGWNLEQCKPNVRGWPWQVLGAIRAVATVWEGLFLLKKNKNCSRNFQVLQLQAVITPQWLQIAENLLPSGPSTGCLVSIFTIRINSKAFHGIYVPYKKGTYPNFRQRRMSDIAY